MESPVRNSSDSDPSLFQKSGASVFPPTHWTVVFEAGKSELEGSFAALEELCGKYWYPIYAFVRRRGADQHAAEDLTQAFFERLLAKGTIQKADRLRGKFRTFLLAALTNFLNEEWEKRQTLKRGGQRPMISLDEAAAEDRYRQESPLSLPPDQLFERQWAATIMARVTEQQRREYAVAGNAALFELLEPWLAADITAGKPAEWAATLGMTEGNIKVALHRMRRRFGETLRQEIARTVDSPAEVDEEIRALFAALAQ